MEAENTGSSYAEGMLDTDSIPVESENGQEVLTEADGALDYPREEETATSVGMDLDGGTIGESEMDLEGVTSGSAGREYSAQEVSGGMETSGSGILNEIGEFKRKCSPKRGRKKFETRRWDSRNSKIQT